MEITLRGRLVSRGFTLIELLVVIAVVGVLSAVVINQLNSARGKGADASVKSNLVNMRSYGESLYDDNTGYSGVCGNSKMTALKAAAETASGASGSCSDSTSAWRAYVPMKTVSGKVWCVDSAGASRQINTPGAGTSCPTT